MPRKQPRKFHRYLRIATTINENEQRYLGPGSERVKRLPAEFKSGHPFRADPPVLHGRFRSSLDVCQIKARNDLQAVLAWLAEFADSPYTFSNYRKEVERLILWASSLEEPQALSGLAQEDFTRYERFLADPQPAERWVGPPLPRTHEDWKPFAWRNATTTTTENGETKVVTEKVAGLNDASRRQAFDVLRALYSYLHKVGYLLVNPLAIKRRRRGKRVQRKSVNRYLDRETWSFLIDYIETLPQETKRDRQHYHRVRWLFYLLYLSQARRSEVASARMVDFYRDDSDGLWYWRVEGKGQKERDVPVSDELLAEFVAYRRFHGLPDEPGIHEETHLVLSITGKSGLTPKAVYLIVKEICQRAAEVLRETNPKKAEKLSHATTHWMRHTSASHFVNEGGDIRAAQDKLGHEDIRTTMLYQHAEKTDLHKKTVKLKVRS